MGINAFQFFVQKISQGSNQEKWLPREIFFLNHRKSGKQQQGENISLQAEKAELEAQKWSLRNLVFIEDLHQKFLTFILAYMMPLEFYQTTEMQLLLI